MKHLSFNLDLGKPETVIVLGAGRGGTSLVAGTLRCLGICMGSNPHPAKHEWSPVVYASDEVDLRATLRNIEVMNRTYPVWGWKSPADVFSLDSILPLLRNPAFLIVTRDLVEVTLSAGRYTEVQWEIGFYENASVYQLIAARLRFWPYPAMAVPFQEMLTNPGEFVEFICSYLQIAPTAEQKQQAIDFCDPRQNAYRSVDQKAPVSISPKDLEKDTANIAALYIPRYAQEFLQHFEGMRKEAELAFEMLSGHLSREARKGLIEAVLARMRALFVRFAADLSKSEAQMDVEQAAPSDGGSSVEIRAMLDAIESAAESVAGLLRQTSLPPAEGYRLLRRFHRIFLLLIGMRTELQKGLQSFAPCAAEEVRE